MKQDKKWGYVDKTGQLIIPFKFDHAYDFSEGLAAVEIKEKTGYIDKTGKFVIPPRFISGFPFSDGMALVVIRRSEKDKYPMNKLGYIDKSGKLAIQLKETLDSKSLHVTYKGLYFSEGLVYIEHGKLGYIDKAGKTIIPPQYNDTQPFSEGLAAVKLEDKYGYIDRSGKMVIPPQFSDAGPFSEGLAPVQIDSHGDQEGYIDKSGKLVISGGEFSAARAFSEGLAAVRGKNDKYGFIDKTGKFVIPPRYDRVSDFSEGLAAVQSFDVSWPGDLSYIDHTGQIIIKSISSFPNSPMKTEFDLHNYRFCGGVALVNLGKTEDEDAMAYINKEGKFIWPKVAPSK
ncbi:MAG: WG repeat-containing protein [Desulfobaccales bacterium]